jgi:predicted transcriptional regulator
VVPALPPLTPSALVLAIAPRWAAAILDGSKTVEVRRQAPRSGLPAHVLLYATAPTAAVVGRAVLDQVREDTPERLWGAFGSQTALTKGEFDRYVAGCARPAAWRMATPVRIEPIRPAFRAPQSWLRLRPERPDHADLFAQALSGLDLVRHG